MDYLITIWRFVRAARLFADFDPLKSTLGPCLQWFAWKGIDCRVARRKNPPFAA
jgi:hypothetical protein